MAIDEEVLSEEGNHIKTTIGAWLCRLLAEQEYHDTMLRLPVPVARDVAKRLDEAMGEALSNMGTRAAASAPSAEVASMGATIAPRMRLAAGSASATIATWNQ